MVLIIFDMIRLTLNTERFKSANFVSCSCHLSCAYLNFQPYLKYISKYEESWYFEKGKRKQEGKKKKGKLT